MLIDNRQISIHLGTEGFTGAERRKNTFSAVGFGQERIPFLSTQQRAWKKHIQQIYLFLDGQIYKINIFKFVKIKFFGGKSLKLISYSNRSEYMEGIDRSSKSKEVLTSLQSMNKMLTPLQTDRYFFHAFFLYRNFFKRISSLKVNRL